jgi:predicted esterase
MANARWTALAWLGASSLVGCANSPGAPSDGTGAGGSNIGSSNGGSESDGGSSSGSGGSSGSPGGSSAGGGAGSSSGGTSSSSGSSGSTSSSGSGSSSGAKKDAGGGSSGTVMTSGDGPKIPAVSGTCPTIATGTITVLGQSVQIWTGKKGDTPAPILFYWHGTGSSSAEASLMGTQITEITNEGGVVASFSTSTTMGTDTGDAVWYTGDFAMADQILACAVQQYNIDTRRIITAGCSAGGLQAGAMVYGRSSYLACAMPNSGGTVGNFFPFEDKHVPSLITTHGGSSDMVVISFAMSSATEDMAIASAAATSMPPGGYVVDCNHGGGHCGAPANDIAAQWQFCKDHPFGVSSDPYASGLPSSFPTYCMVIK